MKTGEGLEGRGAKGLPATSEERQEKEGGTGRARFFKGAYSMPTETVQDTEVG